MISTDQLTFEPLVQDPIYNFYMTKTIGIIFSLIINKILQFVLEISADHYVLLDVCRNLKELNVHCIDEISPCSFALH